MPLFLLHLSCKQVLKRACVLLFCEGAGYKGSSFEEPPILHVQIALAAEEEPAAKTGAKKKKKKKGKKMSKEEAIKAAHAAQAAAAAALEKGGTHEDAAKAADALLKVRMSWQRAVAAENPAESQKTLKQSGATPGRISSRVHGISPRSPCCKPACLTSRWWPCMEETLDPAL